MLKLTKEFPKEETYSLTDQIRRSSRSVAINIREGYAKRKYEQVFVRHLIDSLGSSEETRGWLDFAKDCKYITESECKELDDRYDEISAMLYRLANNWHNFSDIWSINGYINYLKHKRGDERWKKPNHPIPKYPNPDILISRSP